MRVLVVALTAAVLAIPASAARRVTVEQLQQTIEKAQGRSDSDIARELGGLDLTERLTADRLKLLKDDVPGEKSRQALVVLADSSAFLDPPASEIPATATPGSAAQRRMMAQTVAYLGKSLPLLPNLFATRETDRFEDKPVAVGAGETEGNPLRPAGRSAVTVLYRDNQEFIDAGKQNEDKPRPHEKGLTTWGEFGPILGTVLIDAARSQLSWSHWELGTTGPQAVFRYTVPKEKSHYDVRFCCVGQAYGMEVNEARQRAGYHGEIAVDPESGAILRLTVVADFIPGNPISLAAIAVEYAPIEIGSKMYICPTRGVALARAPDPKLLQSELRTARSGGLPPLQQASLPSEPATPVAGPEQTLLNDIAFRNYHLFRGESRVVPEKELAANSAAGASVAAPRAEAIAALPATAAAPDNMRPAQEVAAEDAAELAKSTSSALAAQPALAAMAASGASASGEAMSPEIAVGDTLGLPSEPAQVQSSGSGAGFTLRINSRLVDVAVVALDKKGKPLTNLKATDLEIFDNGVKQDIRSFTPANPTPAPAEAQATAAPATEPALSNKPLAKSGPEPNTIVLLMDGANLAFNDLANAREQSVRFIKGLPDGQLIALYEMRKGGFRTLVEASADHEAVAARLAKWMPTAADFAEAQFNEARNRQSLDTVHNLEDLLSVNGNTTLDASSQQQALDAKLRPLGSDPPKSALGVLVDVGRHLGAFPGHKSLVWVTSDNALADWTNASTTIEKSSKFIEPAALRVQEAMNNAHVSVYPLDASVLEANVVDASKHGRNVELTPTYITPPNGEIPGGLGTEAQAGPNPINLIQATDMQHDWTSNRLFSQMQQDMHPIQGVFREVAEATGGQALRRSNNIVGQLNGVENDGRATYELAFSPNEVADGKYHLITVKMVGRKDVQLRYRTGFQYDKDSSTIKERFTRAVWESGELTDISLSATPATSDGSTLKLNIAATDLALAQDGAFWTDKIDVFLVRRDDSQMKAQVTGKTIGLRLKSDTYQKLLRDGIPFDQLVAKTGTTSVRIVVVDENSGRMGTLTVPTPTLMAAR